MVGDFLPRTAQRLTLLDFRFISTHRTMCQTDSGGGDLMGARVYWFDQLGDQDQPVKFPK